jgi:3-deoxy-manno-octulosonate cytidylyltransferase (CMP-KDO synthetase)
MNTLVLIPARMGSSRFPGKPMALIKGEPMIGRVYKRVCEAKSLTTVAVATCDEIIADYIRSIGGIAVMTSKTHERASDRCAEALLKLEEDLQITYDIVVMVQGDEPMIHPDMISEAMEPLLKDSSVNVSNLLGEIKDHSEFLDRNCIKVVCDLNSDALYFSREPIPTMFKNTSVPMGKQVCVIPFKRNFLLEYSKLAPTPLEILESIDMLRILEYGMKVRMVKTKHPNQSVDSIEDLRKVVSLMEEN